ncbi:MAG: choice-of-anchor A family protein, partial [Caldilineaceae bacterium]|nr:choice-of-anchor A family protein [Caldilineaceae bacterium]
MIDHYVNFNRQTHGGWRSQWRRWLIGWLLLLLLLFPLDFPLFPQTVHTAYAADCATNLTGMLTAMKRYNLITLGDLATTSDVEGRTFVGGNFTSGNSANLAIRMNNVAKSEETFVVVGNLAAGNALNLNGGSLRLGGVRNNRAINFNGGGSLIADSTLSNATLTEQLQSGSKTLAQVSANNTASFPGSQPGPLRFTVANVTSGGLAVFQVNAADVFANSRVQ